MGCFATFVMFSYCINALFFIAVSWLFWLQFDCCLLMSMLLFWFYKIIYLAPTISNTWIGHCLDWTRNSFKSWNGGWHVIPNLFIITIINLDLFLKLQYWNIFLSFRPLYKKLRNGQYRCIIKYGYELCFLARKIFGKVNIFFLGLVPRKQVIERRIKFLFLTKFWI